MRQASVILPLFSNAGASLSAVHGELRSALVDAFGGYTAQAVQGSWRDDTSGRLYHDDSTEYRVAADWSNERLERRLLAIAARFGALAGQLSMFVVLGSGEVVFVDSAAYAEGGAGRVAQAG